MKMNKNSSRNDALMIVRKITFFRRGSMNKRRWLLGVVAFLLICLPIYAAAQQPTKIRISDNGPLDVKTNSYYLIAKIMGEQLEKYYPGKYKVEYYPSSQLYKSIPAHKAVLGGAIEACYSYDGLIQSVFGDDVGFPFLCTMVPAFDDFDKYWQCSKEVLPLLSKEYLEPRGAIIKGMKAGWGGDLFLTKAAYKIGDLKGRKIRVVPGDVMETCSRLMGINPVSMDVSEALAAAKSGTVDGIMSTFGAGGVRLKFYSAGKYVTPPSIPGISNAGFLFWNLKFWNSLPQEVRDKLDKEILPYAEKEGNKADKAIFDTGWQIMTADGAVKLDWKEDAVQEFFTKAGRPTVEKLTPKIGAKWVNMIKKYASPLFLK
jgi:TRAP-type C4-dicarboxylate transport system substrate-binding protein